MPTTDEILAALARAGHRGAGAPSPTQIGRAARELSITPHAVMLAVAGLDAARTPLTPAELDATLATFRRTGVIGPAAPDDQAPKEQP